MTRLKLPALFLAALLASAALPARADDPVQPTGLHVVAKIAGADGGWDYASFDVARGRVYVAHGDQVMAIDAASGKANLAFAPGARLHAVVAVPGAEVLVTTNSGDSSARIISAADGHLIASLPTPKDPDSAVYDPATRKVAVIGGDSGTVLLVNPRRRTAAPAIEVGGKLEFADVDGKGLLYVNDAEAATIVVVDLVHGKVLTRHPLTGCLHPTGLAFVSGGRLVSACANGVAKIMDAHTGEIIASPVIGARPDAVIYDPARELAMIPAGAGGTLTVIALSGPHDNQVIDTVATQIGARTGAVDPKTGRVYLPTAEYNLPVPAGQRPSTKPGTFVVLVLDRS